MKLKGSDVPEGGLSLAFQGQDSAWEGLTGLSVETAPHGCLSVQKRGQDVLVEGEVRAALWFECSRCLESFRYPVEISFRQVLRPLEEGLAELKEIELNAEDIEFGCYDEDTLYLDSIVEEQLLLSLPMKPLCKGECKGLCPQCGRNRNEKECTCPESTRESPFDCLKEFVVQKR